MPPKKIKKKTPRKKRRFSQLIRNKGLINKGTIYLAVIIICLIFAAFTMVGGTFPEKLPKPSNKYVDLIFPPNDPASSTIQMHTFYGITLTPPPTQPTPPNPVPSSNIAVCTPTITGDTSLAPELKNWVDNTLIPDLTKFYPAFVQALALPEYTPFCSFKIFIDPNFGGIAYAKPQEIVLSKSFFMADQTAGAVQHEMAHIIQDYDFGNIPSWVSEGIADWARGYIYKDTIYTKPDPGSSYTDGYRTTAYFFNWIQTKYDPNLVHKLNVIAHNDTYTNDFWTQNTGKTVDQLWNEMMSNN